MIKAICLLAGTAGLLLAVIADPAWSAEPANSIDARLGRGFDLDGDNAVSREADVACPLRAGPFELESAGPTSVGGIYCQYLAPGKIEVAVYPVPDAEKEIVRRMESMRSYDWTYLPEPSFGSAHFVAGKRQDRYGAMCVGIWTQPYRQRVLVFDAMYGPEQAAAIEAAVPLLMKAFN